MWPKSELTWWNLITFGWSSCCMIPASLRKFLSTFSLRAFLKTYNSSGISVSMSPYLHSNFFSSRLEDGLVDFTERPFAKQFLKLIHLAFRLNLNDLICRNSIWRYSCLLLLQARSLSNIARLWRQNTAIVSFLSVLVLQVIFHFRILLFAFALLFLC